VDAGRAVRRHTALLLLSFGCGHAGYEAECVETQCVSYLDTPGADRCYYDALSERWSAPDVLAHCPVDAGCFSTSSDWTDAPAERVCVANDDGSWPPPIGRANDALPACEERRIARALEAQELQSQLEWLREDCHERQAAARVNCYVDYATWTGADCRAR